MMNSLQTDLYQRLQKFELDDPPHEFGFTRHLMKNHGWTRDYAQRAITEYKKFAFLTVVANHQVVPSDQVDQKARPSTSYPILLGRVLPKGVGQNSSPPSSQRWTNGTCRISSALRANYRELSAFLGFSTHPQIFGRRLIFDLVQN